MENSNEDSYKSWNDTPKTEQGPQQGSCDETAPFTKEQYKSIHSMSRLRQTIEAEHKRSFYRTEKLQFLRENLTPEIEKSLIVVQLLKELGIR